MRIPKLVKEIPSLVVPKKIRDMDRNNIFFINSHAGSLPSITDYAKYFSIRYHEREPQIEYLIKKYMLYNKTCLSICSGLGQDEILLSLKGDIVIDCIEKDTNSVNIHKDFLKRFGIKTTTIYNMDMRDFNIDKRYDIIFTSSPSNWMEEPMLKGIPSYFLDFVDTYSKVGTYFIARLYGANLTDYLMKPFFISLLKKRLSHNGFDMMEYEYKYKIDEKHTIAESIFVSRKG